MIANEIHMPAEILVVLIGLAIFLAVVFRMLWQYIAKQDNIICELDARVDELAQVCSEYEPQLAAMRLEIQHVRQDMALYERLARESGSSAYQSAISLAKKGFNVNQLISACGISIGEAELILQLHGISARSVMK